MKRAAKALIVDDSRIALQMTGCVLNKHGIEDVTQAEDGLQALEHFLRELLNGTPYSLVFLDIVMPFLDGQETLRRMRAMERDAGIAVEDRAVIIMATALHAVDDMVDALIGGDCTDYLVKPFAAEDLRGMLGRYDF